jgi:hypothetical protein
MWHIVVLTPQYFASLERQAEEARSESVTNEFRRRLAEAVAAHEETVNQEIRWSHLRSQWIAAAIRGVVVRKLKSEASALSGKKRKWT